MLHANAGRFPATVQTVLPRWCEISKQLRRDRELAFYGSEDVTPSEFYGRAEADAAHGMAHEVVDGVVPHVA